MSVSRRLIFMNSFLFDQSVLLCVMHCCVWLNDVYDVGCFHYVVCHDCFVIECLGEISLE